jgi:hypothetical protein
MKKRQVYVIKDQGKGVVSGVTANSLFPVSEDSTIIVGGGSVETDPIFTASPAFGITEADKTLWNDKDYTHLSNLPDLSLKADLVGSKVPASQLPSYVDDVLEYPTLSGFPITGESGKIYVALDSNKLYRWSGTTYIEVSPMGYVPTLYPKVKILDYTQDATNYILRVSSTQSAPVNGYAGPFFEVVIHSASLKAQNISIVEDSINQSTYSSTGYPNLGRVTSILIPKASNTAPAWNNDIIGIMVILLGVDSADGGANSPFNPRRLAVDMDLIGNIKPKQSQLVSGVNIKTINGQSLIGAGDVTVSLAGSIPFGLSMPGFFVSDQLGWVKLDGRLINSLTTTQQVVAISLGFTVNIPDATNSVFMQNGGTLGGVTGSNTKTIAVENLPTDTITTSNDGDHFHETGEEGRYYDNPDFKTTGASLVRHYTLNQNSNVSGGSTDAVKTSTNGSHSHTIQLNNGSQTGLDITPKSLSVNMFIYLGL